MYTHILIPLSLDLPLLLLTPLPLLPPPSPLYRSNIAALNLCSGAYRHLVPGGRGINVAFGHPHRKYRARSAAACLCDFQVGLGPASLLKSPGNNNPAGT